MYICDSITAIIEERKRLAAQAQAKAKWQIQQYQEQVLQARKRTNQNTVQCILNVMQNARCSQKAAMDLIGIPRNQRPKLGKLLKAARIAQANPVEAE